MLNNKIFSSNILSDINYSLQSPDILLELIDFLGKIMLKLQQIVCAKKVTKLRTMTVSF